jgi:hypothetical protein
LIRFFTHFSLSFRVHICLRQLAAMMAAYTRKSLQQLDHADVYAPRIRHRHATGGVVSLFNQVLSTLYSSCVAKVICEDLRMIQVAGALVCG